MNNCYFEEIDEFRSRIEFDKFVQWIELKITDGTVTEEPVQKSYGGFFERWFKCKLDSEIWRLVYPDPPFPGTWEKVNSNQWESTRNP